MSVFPEFLLSVAVQAATCLLMYSVCQYSMPAPPAVQYMSRISREYSANLKRFDGSIEHREARSQTQNHIPYSSKISWQ
jgi:hypothetical protein